MFIHTSIVADAASLWAWLGSRLRCAIIKTMTEQRRPDELIRPTQENVAQLLRGFWFELSTLPDLLKRDEHLLAAACTTALRRYVLEMMLALNGITYPTDTTHLNTYLGTSQRAAMEKTLLLPSVTAESWIGQAVSLVVIYRWYAPQLVAAFTLDYDEGLEAGTLALLQAELSDWPSAITTD
jgi:hypothetical protein